MIDRKVDREAGRTDTNIYIQRVTGTGKQSGELIQRQAKTEWYKERNKQPGMKAGGDREANRGLTVRHRETQRKGETDRKLQLYLKSVSVSITAN